jgi:hypothetical protein
LTFAVEENISTVAFVFDVAESTGSTFCPAGFEPITAETLTKSSFAAVEIKLISIDEAVGLAP